MRQQEDLTLRHPRANGRVRAPPPEKSEVGEANQGKQNPRAAVPEKSAAGGPNQEKPNLRAAGLSFSENLPRRIANLRLKQQVPVKEPEKTHQRGPTGSQKGLKRIHLLRTVPANSNTNLTFTLNFTSNQAASMKLRRLLIL